MNPASRPVPYAGVIKVAVPIALANASTPLLHAVDAAAVGTLHHPKYIAAVALGALLYSFCAWTMGFLRMAAAGLAAQAFGAQNLPECQAVLLRGAVVAFCLAAVLISIQIPLADAGFLLLPASLESENLARSYFLIRILSSPAALLIYVASGWLIGIGKTRLVVLSHLFLNLLNAALDLLFVLHFQLGVQGVAYGTLIAEAAAAILMTALIWRLIKPWPRQNLLNLLKNLQKLRQTLSVNTDIFLRTLALLIVFSFFTAQAAKHGDALLAATAILMHLVHLSAFLLDGFAFTAESFVGQAKGAQNPALLHQHVKRLFIVSSLAAAVVSLIFLIGAQPFIHTLTPNADVRSLALSYSFYVVLSPIIAVHPFLLDGIFIGAAQSRDMRNAMILSCASFFLIWLLTLPLLLHGLWISLLFFFAIRAATLLLRYRALLSSARPNTHPIALKP